DNLGNPGGHSFPISWNKVVEENPEVLVIAPCGIQLNRAQEELEVLKRNSGWAGLRAVQNGNVYLTDPNLFTQPSTSLIDGIELLAAILHPQLFEVPEYSAHRFTRIQT